MLVISWAADRQLDLLRRWWEGGVAVVTGERSDVGGNFVVAASQGDSATVYRVVTKGEEVIVAVSQ